MSVANRLAAAIRRRRRPRVVGVSMVRNEVGVVGVSVRHQLSLGLSEVLVVDNGSTDGTDRVLAQLARRHPISWTRDDSGYRQAEIITELAHEAHRRGADWVLPFDADEFWLAPGGSLREALRTTTADVLQADALTFVQARWVDALHPRALLTMTRRTREPVGPMERTRELVEARRIAFVEMAYPTKVVVRARPDVVIALGNHEARSAARLTTEATTALVCLHAPLPARIALEKKAEQGRRADAAGHAEGLNWHLRRWARLEAEAGLEEEWAANSYDGDGTLDAYGRRVSLATDTRLRDAVARQMVSDGIELP